MCCLFTNEVVLPQSYLLPYLLEYAIYIVGQNGANITKMAKNGCGDIFARPKYDFINLIGNEEVNYIVHQNLQNFRYVITVLNNRICLYRQGVQIIDVKKCVERISIDEQRV